MAAASQHRIMLTFPQLTPSTPPSAGDVTSGQVWLYDRNDRPVNTAAGAVVTTVGGGSVVVQAGGLVHEWALEAVNTTYDPSGSLVIGSYVTPLLYANTGTVGVPQDSIWVDGWANACYYRFQVVYRPVSGAPFAVSGDIQLDALTDYVASGGVGPDQGGGVFPVLSDVLSPVTLGSSEVRGFIQAEVAAMGAPLANLTATTAPGVGDDTGDGYAVGSRWINTATGKEYVAVDVSSGAAVWVETTAGAAGGIGNVVEDITPQLGGDLDLNGNDITGMVIGTDVQAWDAQLDDLSTTGATAAELDTLTDGSNADSLHVHAAGGLANVVEDTTPQLGGDLDLNGNDITGMVIGTDIQAHSAVLDATTASFLTADETKLDGIETAATADQTAGEIKTSYESNADTNEFSDAEQTKLAGIETGADVTDATNVAAAGAHMSGGTDVPVADGGTGASTAAGARTALDVDQAGTDNSTDVTLAGAPDYITIAGQVITRNAVDLAADVSGALPVTDLDATGSPSSSTFLRGDGSWAAPAGGGGGDLLAANNLSDLDNAGTSRTNLGVAIGSDVQAHSAVLDATTASFLTADETKLDGIETAATADQTGAQIKVAYEAEADTNAFTDANVTTLGNQSGTNTGDEPAASTTAAGVVELLTTAELDTGTDPTRAATAVAIENSARSAKLDGIEAGADVTDAANVTAAGALMDSEVDADIKTLSLPASTTITAAAATVLDDASVAAMRTTLDVDQAGTDNSTDVTLGGSLDYVTLAGQVLTRNAIDLTTDTTGDLAVADGGTGSSTASDARTALGVAIGSDVQAHSAVLDATTAAFLTADETKLDGIETAADVTDATNVAAAGAVMDTLADAKGDIVAASAADTFTRLAVGTDGQVLTADSGETTGVKWSTLAGGGDALVANPLSQFAATTSAQLAGVLSDETGSGAAVFATSPTLVTPALGTPSALVGTNITGTAAGLTVGATTGVEAGADVTDATNVAAAGAHMSGGTDVPVADGGTGASTAAGARTNLDVDQAGTDNSTDVTLAGALDYLTIAGQVITRNAVDLAADVSGALPVTDLDATGTPSSSTFLRGDGSWAAPAGGGDMLAANNLSDLDNAGTSRTNLGVAIGSDVQAHSAVLDATTASFLTADETKLDGIEASADVTDTANVTAAGALMDSEVDADIKTLTLPASTTISTFGASLVDDASASAARTTMGVAIGSDVQAYDAELAALAGLTSAADKVPYFTGSGTAAVADLTSAARDELAAMALPQTVTGTTDTLAAADARRLTMYSNASAVTVTVPTGTFSAGDWFMLQSTGAGGLGLSTSGITLNGSSPNTSVAQNEGLMVIFTASNTISVLGGTS